MLKVHLVSGSHDPHFLTTRIYQIFRSSAFQMTSYKGMAPLLRGANGDTAPSLPNHYRLRFELLSRPEWEPEDWGAL
jgi:hypothetical protein